ncbi:GAF and ANTAR domain-containing protein [Actinomycetospora endophytica]|uniref:GAF and ANTAR domain-containing protein n=1 Tax=Actinomycetospora endophytica TaxID=2291215 RepID=A0ABS8PEY3_9PSEU|nr:GAF and ANTAR domain-containing protein [Actinomycetospora endophytica]MCD2195564.1 GAF and ANTAR domain-containing protein [Actinomycetospora endophytica]
MTTPAASSEQALLEAFVRLADTLVTDFDVIDLFQGLCTDCVDLLGADAAGLLISDQRGSLQVVSASTEQAHLVELFALQADQGPCLECFRTSTQVRSSDLDGDGRWPLFARRAVEEGFAAVHALPMRLRGETIGALNLFHRRPHAMQSSELGVGQALADVATIAILSDRSARERELLTEQLQSALTSRIVIEQAKGVVAERAGISVDEAFVILRGYARRTRTQLTGLARGVVDGSVPTDPLTGS